MTPILWILLSLGLVSALSGIGLGIGQNITNTKNVESTNATNLQSVQETNQSNVEQSELAYRRSLPTAQVRNLMAAGMSRAGALSMLTGGGSYTAPVLQSASADAPQVDYSPIASSIDRLNNIPTNVEQMDLVNLQKKALEQDTINKQAAEVRAQEQHEFDMWQKLYGKNATIQIDTLASDIVSQSADKGISLDGIDSIDKLVKSFDLKNNKTWRNMPAYARNQVLDSVRTQAAENRAIQAQNDSHRAANDAHDIAELAKSLERIKVKYANQKEFACLISMLRNNENLLQDGKIKFQDARSKEFENYVREFGIDNEADARRVGELSKKLAADDEVNIQLQRQVANKNTLGVHDQFRVLLRDLGELFLHVKL